MEVDKRELKADMKQCRKGQRKYNKSLRMALANELMSNPTEARPSINGFYTIIWWIDSACSALVAFIGSIFVCSVIYSESSSTWGPLICIIIGFIVVNLLRKLLYLIIEKVSMKSAMKLLNPLEQKYLMLREQYFDEEFTKREFVKDSDGAWFKDTEKSSFTIKGNDALQAIKCDREYSAIRLWVKSVKVGNGNFQTGINLFDREFVIVADEQIKTKSFFSSTMINLLLDNIEKVKELRDESLSVDGDRLKLEYTIGERLFVNDFTGYTPKEYIKNSEQYVGSIDNSITKYNFLTRR